jgi:hypothetical protein
VTTAALTDSAGGYMDLSLRVAKMDIISVAIASHLTIPTRPRRTDAMTVWRAALKMASSHMFGAAHQGGQMLARMPAWLAASVVVARAEDQARGQ